MTAPALVERLRITQLVRIKRPRHCLTTNLGQILAGIQTGTWRASVEVIRQHHKGGQTKQAERAKARLPAILFSGEFSEATDKGLVQHSGLVVVDIDDLSPSEMERVRTHACTLAWVASCFTSPKGAGLKLICRIHVQPSPAHHKAIAQALQKHCQRELGVTVDSAPEVSRKCFVSFDPELFQNLEAAPWVPSTSGEDFTEETEGMRDAGVGGNDVVPSPLPPLFPLSGCGWPTDAELDTQIERYYLVPDRKHGTHRLLLGLARLTLTLKERMGRDLTDAERGSLFDRWYDLARSKDPEFVWRGEGAYWLEFESMVKIARIALGNPVIRRAWELANSEPLPLAATTGRVGKSTCTRMLVALCFQLSRMDPVNGCFFLGCRDAGKCLELSAQQAATLLAGLATTGILELVNAGTKGPNGKAARYRWAWAAERTATTPPGST